MRYFVYWAVVAIIVFIVRKFTHRAKEKRKSTATQFLGNLFEIIIIAVALFYFLSQFETTKNINGSILKSSSLIIAIITFAAQKVLSNIVAGIVLAMTKPFDVGDKITVMNGSLLVATGVVIEMTVRHTVLKMADGRCAIIPNGYIDSNVVINDNTLEDNGYPLTMVCSYDSDVKKAMVLMEEQIKEHPLTKNNDNKYKTNLTCSNLIDKGFELKGFVWAESVADNFKACSDLRISIYEVWKENGIEVRNG